MFSRDEEGSILLFNYPLFGGWLPFIGFITFYPDDDLEYDEPLKAFMIEWFCTGIAITRDERMK